MGFGILGPKCAHNGGELEGSAARSRTAEDAAATAASFRATTASVLEVIREAEELAAEHGDSVKQSAQADVLMRKWLRFLLIVGAEYGFCEGD